MCKVLPTPHCSVSVWALPLYSLSASIWFFMKGIFAIKQTDSTTSAIYMREQKRFRQVLKHRVKKKRTNKVDSKLKHFSWNVNPHTKASGTSLQFEPTLRRFIYLHHITQSATVRANIMTNPLRHWWHKRKVWTKKIQKERKKATTAAATKSNSKENSFCHSTQDGKFCLRVCECVYVCVCVHEVEGIYANENYLVT